MHSKRRANLRAMVAAIGSGVLLAATSQVALAQGKYEWPRSFNVVTPIVGTANHSLTVAWSAKFQAGTGARVAVLPAPNGFARAGWLNTGEARLALVQTSDYFDQMDAVQGYASKSAGPSDTRLAFVGLVTPWGYAVRGDSKIKSIEDVGPGTKISLAKSSSFLVSGVNALLAYRNLKPSDVELVEVGSYGANTAVLVEGRVDVTFTSPISGPSYQAEAGPNGLRWLGIPPRDKDPQAFARYRDIMAGYVRQNTTAGVKSAVGLPLDHAFQTYHVRAEDDPEFVYQLVKWLMENHDTYKADFTHAHMMNLDNIVGFLEAGALHPLHEGTIRYLKEKGLWKDAYQARQDKLVALAKGRADAFKAAIAVAEQKGINVDPANAEWVALWQDYRKQHGMQRSFGQEVLSLN